MKRNVTACSAWRLYVIIDRQAAGSRDLVEVATAAIRGGADVIQLRDKTASSAQLIEEGRRLLPLTRASGVPLIINDRVEVARSIGADGVHLGQEDGSIEEARVLLGEHRLIGRSTHSLEQARRAEAEGADYIGLGPIFPTPTKPGYGSVGTALISAVAKQVRPFDSGPPPMAGGRLAQDVARTEAKGRPERAERVEGRRQWSPGLARGAPLPIVCIGGIDDATIKQVVEAGATCVAVVRAVCCAHDPEVAARHLKNIVSRPRSTVSATRLGGPARLGGGHSPR